MPLVLVRVDCRLIHGQIVEAWIPFTRADCVVVANDEAAGDRFQKSIMAMAMPPDIELAVLSVREAVHGLTNGRWSNRKVILLFSKCQDALASLRAGLRFDHLNLGNLDCTPRGVQVSYSVFLDQNDLACLSELENKGILVEARRIPQDVPQKLTPLNLHRPEDL